MQNAGIDRINRFGDMNIIDDFCGIFPAYKHDDVFQMEFICVIDRMARNTILGNVSERVQEALQPKK